MPWQGWPWHFHSLTECRKNKRELLSGVQADHAERQAVQSGRVTFNQRAKQRPQEGRGCGRGRGSERNRGTGGPGQGGKGSEAVAVQAAGVTALPSGRSPSAARRTKFSFDQDEDV